MWFTSNYKTAGRHPHAVATSQGIPKWFRGRQYDPLKPEWYMIRIARNGGQAGEARYIELYNEKILAPLDPFKVIEDLGDDAILLCYEEPGEFCHRRLVADWLKTTTGLWVPEWKAPDLFDLMPNAVRV